MRRKNWDPKFSIFFGVGQQDAPRAPKDIRRCLPMTCRCQSARPWVELLGNPALTTYRPSTLRIMSGPAQIFWKWMKHNSTRTSFFLPRVGPSHLSCCHDWDWLRLATPLGLAWLRRATRICLAGNGLNAARACLAKIGTTTPIRFA